GRHALRKLGLANSWENGFGPGPPTRARQARRFKKATIASQNASMSSKGMTRPAPSATKREAPVSEKVTIGKPHDIASSTLRLMASHRDVHASTSAARY